MKNGDIVWQEDDGSYRKVTQKDIHVSPDYETRVKVYFNGEYLPLWEGMKKTFDAC